jgi:CubicO group peptidase (beta-lactamase class C family)
MVNPLLRCIFLWLLATVAVDAAAADDPLPGLRAAIERGDYPKTTSLLVMRRGELVYEAYFGEGNREMLNDTRSAMKAITALAVGAAIADGAIPSAQAPAFQLFTDLRPFKHDTADKESVRLADLLSMSSPLDCDDNDDNSPGAEDRMHEQPDWTRWGVDLPTYPGFSRNGQGFGAWRYCTINAVLAGQIVQRAVHKPVDQYLASRLFAPLEISQWQWPRSPAGEVMTGGGLRLRSRDIAKIAAMMADGGRWREQQIIPASWIDEMLTARHASRPDQNYGYFIFEGRFITPCGPIDTWYMAGNGGSQILILRQQHTAIVLTRQNYNVKGTSGQSVELLEKFVLPGYACGTTP